MLPSAKNLKVEQIPADIDAEITLDQVLAVGEGESIKFGAPLVSGASVKATVVSARSSQESDHLQDASPEALPEARRPSPELYRTAHRRDQRVSAPVKEQINMAHKKAGGSSRERPRLRVEAPRREGVRRSGHQRWRHHRSSTWHAHARRAKTSVSARITPCSR